MKKLRFALLFLLLAACLLAVPASAATAYPNQKLSFRTGPNTRYTEMFTLPQSTYIYPIELEEGNGVDWVLCEFSYNGNTYYGYTGLKRMDIAGSLSYADHLYISCINRIAGNVYTAPYYEGAVTGRLGALELVNLLKYDGSWAYIEFYDSANKSPSRGWVEFENINLSDALACFATESSSVYADPYSSADKVGKIGKYEMIGYIETIGSFDYIAYYNASKKMVMTGFVPSSIVDAYRF